MLNLSFIATKSHKKPFYYVKKSLFVIFLMTFYLSCKDEEEACRLNKHNIYSKMQEQENSWNEGDLEGFMKHYWKSDSLRFIGKSGLNQGWQKTLDNYKKSYKTKKEMGKLKFTNKSLDFIGERSIFVIGEWHLQRQDSLGDLRGMYSLVWQQKNGNWVITTDHSS
ncbi:MAG: nuclear transport factor 2 family protein [Flavobacteriales bacterium]